MNVLSLRILKVNIKYILILKYNNLLIIYKVHCTVFGENKPFMLKNKFYVNLIRKMISNSKN